MLDLLRPHRLTRRRLFSAALLSLVVTGLVWLAGMWLHWLDFPEMKLLDWRFRVRGQRPTPRDVLIVALDDKTMNAARRLSPVPRELLADIVRRLADAGAKTIVLDVALPDRLPGDEDEKLRDALLSNATNVILAAFINDQGQLDPPARYFEDVAAGGVGLAHMEEANVDHVVRWDKPVRNGMPSLALVAYAHFKGLDVNDFLRPSLVTPNASVRGHWSLDTDGRLLIDFVGPQGAIARISAADVLDGKVSARDLKGKLVLIGGTWSFARDVHFVPFATYRAELDTRLMTGVEVQANCVATLLARPPLRVASAWVNFLLLLVIVLLVSVVMVLFPPTAALLMSLALSAVWVEAALQLFVRERWVVNIAPPLTGIAIACLASALVTERRAHYLRRHFRRYVGREVADQIAEMSDDEIGRMGKARVVTILFSDIRGYTQFSRALEPDRIVDFLNRYFNRMTAVARAHNGFVDKFIGDGLMVVFGIFSGGNGTESVPYEHRAVPDGRRTVPDGRRTVPDGRRVVGNGLRAVPDSARDAARAALAMRDAIEDLRKDFQNLSIGIGLHTGKVVTGEIGTPDKADFTAVGSAVNLASRIEDETRRVFQSRWDRGEQPSVIILMSHATYELIKDMVEARPIGEVTVRGLEDEEVKLWELLSMSSDH